MENCNSTAKMDRKTAEKNRRIHMKNLYTRLNSLITGQQSKEVPMLSDQLEEATIYIKALQVKLEKLKERKKSLVEINNQMNVNMGNTSIKDLKIPYIEVQNLGSALVVLLICGMDHELKFYQSIRILEEEGAEVVNAGFFVMDDKFFHTLHSKISENFEATRVSERLYKMVHE